MIPPDGYKFVEVGDLFMPGDMWRDKETGELWICTLHSKLDIAKFNLHYGELVRPIANIKKLTTKRTQHTRKMITI